MSHSARIADALQRIEAAADRIDARREGIRQGFDGALRIAVAKSMADLDLLIARHSADHGQGDR